ncbi:S8 family peptidase [Actomonas aquatica]|uniref:S8 family serine peptidase n=1 Tax=Actomonas aquatica TaxID=2866162 RepID=A0ABZ1C6U4_9BACT|nr:S8 family serine peptidase [Opitutus sp. WL0086]WRQ87448.1 S8 family serine peptidase [Opitutus sp. WL0086]
MKTKYLILRSDPLSSNFPHLAGMNPNLADIGHVPLFGAFGTPGGRAGGDRDDDAPFEREPKLELDEFDVSRAENVRRMNDVVGLAPVMPTRLIAPLQNLPASTLPSAATHTWGVEAVNALSSPCDGAGLTAAVLDTGIDRAHPAFVGVNIVEEDFTGQGNGDSHGHGTHCAGTVLGRAVGGKRIGVATGTTRLLAGKVLGAQGGDTAWSIDGILWAARNGASVISMSLGIDFPGYVDYLQQQGLPVNLATSFALEGYRKTILIYEKLAGFLKNQAFFGQTCLIVAAAGNENQRFQNPTWNISVAPPAVSEGILSVGALGQGQHGLQAADFSNSGPNFAAPGVAVESAAAGTPGLVSWAGTSMATPHVAGVALLWAQWLQARNQLTPQNLEARLLASAVLSPLASGYEPADVGLGLVQAPQTV